MSMKWEKTPFKGTLARAKGLGSARSVVDGWIALRVTSVALAVLSIWFVWFVFSAIGMTHAEFTALLAQPLNAVAMILLIVMVMKHSLLGAREVVEDYIHCEVLKTAKLVSHYLLHVAMGVACIFAVLKIAL